jgi:hypothetical protein
VRGVLDALGVPAARIPASTDAQIGLFRSVVADRRMLALLDNARAACSMAHCSCWACADPATAAATRLAGLGSGTPRRRSQSRSTVAAVIALITAATLLDHWSAFSLPSPVRNQTQPLPTATNTDKSTKNHTRGRLNQTGATP